MYFVVVGGGEIGHYLLSLLLEDEHEVVLVEKDPVVAQKIADELDIVAIIDDATKESTLEQAGVRGADSVVVLTGSDEVNLVVGMLAKELGAKKVAIKLLKVNYNKEFLNKLGIDLLFHPEAAAASYLEQMLTKPEIIDLAFLNKGNAEIVEIQITKDIPLLNKQIKDIPQNDKSIIAVFGLKGDLIIPKPDTVLKEGYKVLVLTSLKKEKNN